MTSKPTLVWVPGAWHTPESFAPVIAPLKYAGYDSIGVSKPSTSAGPPYASNFDGDVEAVRAAILSASDAGKDVVVVMHSYGGMPGSAATKGLSKKERTAEGKKGGVISLVYMTSFAMDEGISLVSAAGGKLADWCIVEGEYMRPIRTNEIFYHDIPEEEANKWSAMLQHQAMGSFASGQTYAAFKYIPSTYVICELDRAIPPHVQEAMATQRGANFNIVRLKSSHSPFLSMPNETSEIIRKAAGEVF